MEINISNSDLSNIINKLNPKYNEGKELGANAQEPSTNLNKVERPKVPRTNDPFFTTKGYSSELQDIRMGFREDPRFATEIDEDAMAYRSGYIDGLREFADLNELTIGVPSGGLEVITSDYGLSGFRRGLKLGKPNIVRNYSLSRNNLEKYVHVNKKSDYEKEFEAKQMFDQEGFRVGFVLGVARDYGVSIDESQVPGDDVSYSSFMQGVKGETRNLSSKDEEKIFNNKKMINSDYKVYDYIDEASYNVGLGIWLKSQGIDDVQASQIRHPESLRAFKAGITGEVLSEYEPQLQKQDSVDLDYSLKYEKIDFYNIVNERPSILEINRQFGQIGYDLGKSVKLKK